MNFNQLLQRLVERQASDIHLHCGLPPLSRINGKLMPVSDSKVTTEFTDQLLDIMCDERKRL